MRQLFDQFIVIQKYKTVSGNKQHLVATATADCSIQPLGKDRQNYSDGVFGTTFVAYVENDVHVERGYRVRDEAGTVYSVSDVVVRNYGSQPFKELIIKRTSS